MSINTSGVKVTYEEGMEHLRTFPLDKNIVDDYSYSLLFHEEDGTYNLVNREGMPCWGALREYGCGNRPDDPWPDDLQEPEHIFPKTGNPVALAACFNRICAENISYNKEYYPTRNDWNTFIEFVFNPQISPWKRALKGFELIKNDEGMYWGVVFTDTNIDPNVMVSLLRSNVLHMNLAKNFAQFMRDHPEVDPRIAYLKMGGIDNYNLSGRIVPGKGNKGLIYSGMTIEQLTKLIPA
jgi:hypothetical protein